jgi:hypothetical protein
MNHHPAETVVPLTVDPATASVPARRPMLGAILTDVHFWIPVAVLAFGVGLLVYIS